ncbi:MAG: hypothetical protein RIR70_1252 [Pseudomonadota bacterium]|jgi:cytochrome c oxidase cbb3-type subunit 3
MSDFSAGWSLYIGIVTALGLVWCVWLLLAHRTRTVRLGAEGKIEDTGHVWDGDLRELNNPLPRWWVWMFLISVVFGAVYLALYPGLGAYPGKLGYTTEKAHAEEVAEANQAVKPVYAKYMAMDVKAVAADDTARGIGQRLFLNHCAQCHGSDAGGGKGYPNLTDRDWLYGGEPEAIKTSIVAGRSGVMPAFTQLDSGQIADVANYVRSLSNLAHDSLKSARGKAVFAANCAACHGADGHGNQALGAPNLTDEVWLYGSSTQTLIETVSRGRNGKMPAHEQTLTPEKVHLLTAYVWGLSNKAK